jgi:hypothetical protein
VKKRSRGVVRVVIVVEIRVGIGRGRIWVRSGVKAEGRRLEGGRGRDWRRWGDEAGRGDVSGRDGDMEGVEGSHMREGRCHRKLHESTMMRTQPDDSRFKGRGQACRRLTSFVKLASSVSFNRSIPTQTLAIFVQSSTLISHQSISNVLSRLPP